MACLRPARAIRAGSNQADLDEHIHRALEAAAAHAAHDAGDAQRGAIVGDHDGIRIQRVGLFVQRQNLFAGPGHARLQIAVQLVGVEHMQRTAAILGDQVGGVDQRGDGFHADAFQTILHPFRRGAVLDAADQPACENRTGILVLRVKFRLMVLGDGNLPATG